MRANKCLKKLQEYSTKHQDQSAKFASIVGEKEQEFIESIADESAKYVMNHLIYVVLCNSLSRNWIRQRSEVNHKKIK
jgi:hypothetical protein